MSARLTAGGGVHTDEPASADRTRDAATVSRSAAATAVTTRAEAASASARRLASAAAASAARIAFRLPVLVVADVVPIAVDGGATASPPLRPTAVTVEAEGAGPVAGCFRRWGGDMPVGTGGGGDAGGREADVLTLCSRRNGGGIAGVGGVTRGRPAGRGDRVAVGGMAGDRADGCARVAGDGRTGGDPADVPVPAGRPPPTTR